MTEDKGKQGSNNHDSKNNGAKKSIPRKPSGRNWKKKPYAKDKVEESPIFPFNEQEFPHPADKKTSENSAKQPDRIYEATDDLIEPSDEVIEEIKPSREEISKKDRPKPEKPAEAKKFEKMPPQIPEAEVVESKSKEVRGAINTEAKVSVVTENNKKDEVEEFKENLWDILEQAGITKKKIVIFLIFIIVLILFLIFGWSWIFGDDNRQIQSNEDETVEQEQISQDPEVQQSVTPVGDVPVQVTDQTSIQDDGVLSSYIFGSDQFAGYGDLSGIDASLTLGGSFADEENRYAHYMSILREMDNIYTLDIYNLLDQSTDRRNTLNNLISDMEELVIKASEANQEIVLILNNLNTNFAAISELRDQYETLYFESADQLKGQESYIYLQNFIENTEKTAEIRAYYSAYRLLNEYYVLYLEALRPRLTDIKANIEPLVKGVRVIDVPESDIKAILPYQD